MLSSSDTQGRLRLLRYGLVVVCIVTFLISLLAPLVSLSFVQAAGFTAPPITDHLGTAILFTVIVAILSLVVYAVYHYMLTKTWPFMGGKGGA